MLIRTILLAIAASGIGYGAFHVDRLLEVPLQRAQTIGSLTVDGNGNPIVSGQNVNGAFVSKLDPLGTVVFTFTNQGTYAAGAAVDVNNDVYWFGSGGAPGFPFPFTKKILPVSQLGSYTPGFLVKFRGTDGSVMWAAEIDALQPEAIAIDANGLITLAGFATVAPGVTTPGAYQSQAAGTANPLSLVRLTPEGDPVFAATYGGHSINGTSGANTCISNPWASCLSGPTTTASSVLLDAQGHIWVAGSTNETDLPVTPNALKPTCGCSLTSGDGFLAEFSADGLTLLYATYLGTSTQGPNDTFGNDAIYSAVIDASGSIWLAGITSGADLPTTSDAVQTDLQGDIDGFVLRYDPAVNQLTYGTYYGTQGASSVTKVLIGPDGRPVLQGQLNSNSFNPASFGYDYVGVLTSSGIETTEFLRDGADAGLAFSPSGTLFVGGSGSVIAALDAGSTATPSVFGVANSASLNAAGQVSPGEIISIAGVNLGPVAPVAATLLNGQLPSQLAGVQVLFDGVAAPLLYVSATQINAIAPFGIGNQQETTMVVQNAGASSGTARLGVVSALPAIFTTQSSYQNTPVAAALNEDGSINSSVNRAAPGSTVTVFATGFGALAPPPADGATLSANLPELTQIITMFGPGFVTVTYAGPAPGAVAGAMQINFRLPDVLTQTPSILLFAGGWTAPWFTLWVEGT